MARSYGKLTSTIWVDQDFRGLPNTTTQLLFVALISQPDISACGRLSVATRRWASGMAGASRDDIEAALDALESAGFVWVDYDTDELLVRSFVKHDNGVSNPRRLAAIRNAVTEITSESLRSKLLHEYPFLSDNEDYGERFTERSSNGSPNQSRTDSNPYQQAGNSKQGTAASAELSTAAAAALDMYISWRLSTEPNVRSPDRYAQTIRQSELSSVPRGYELRRTDLEDPKQILCAVFGMSKAQAVEAAAEHRRRNK